MKPTEFDGFKQSGSADFRKLNPHLFEHLQESQCQAALRGASSATASSPKRIRQSSKPLLNKLEAEAMRHYGLALPFWHPQTVKLRLANGCWFTVDFFNFDEQAAVEVKGEIAWEDSLVKLKVAATAYPEIEWTLVWKEDGQWKEQVVLP